MSESKKAKFTQREWDRLVGYGSPPTDQILPEYELDKSTGEVIKIYKEEHNDQTFKE
jgi:hypothetical protein